LIFVFNAFLACVFHRTLVITETLVAKEDYPTAATWQLFAIGLANLLAPPVAGLLSRWTTCHIAGALLMISALGGHIFLAFEQGYLKLRIFRL
jgi:hypothetical protein